MTAHLDAFTRAYIECALWSSTTDDGTPLDRDYSVGNLTRNALRDIISVCADFQRSNAEMLTRAGGPAQNGHDFWLTRNRHGVGFWDRGYPAEVGRALTNAAHAYGESHLYAHHKHVYVS